ncbi:hypothetical protein OPV22_024538 [Ensete ventricosum]|uniref:Uncharacterized protein n=1 Tax=Ensete ventricosum TaxID=4639 RepID=A0AAV8QF86_ENSVE|nr:hypothetical protein OPV22_024538 [Ensete ventricosum]
MKRTAVRSRSTVIHHGVPSTAFRTVFMRPTQSFTRPAFAFLSSDRIFSSCARLSQHLNRRFRFLEELDSLSLIAFRFVPRPYLAIPSHFFHPSSSAPGNSVNNGEEGVVGGVKPSPFGLLLSFSCLHKLNSIYRLLFSSLVGCGMLRIK